MLRNLLRVINLILLVAAVCAAAFFVVAYLELSGFSEAAYEERAEAIHENIQVVREEIERAKEDLRIKEEELAGNLQDLGEEGETLSKRVEDLTAEKNDKAGKADALRAAVDMSSEIRDHMLNMRQEYGAAIRRLEDKINAGESNVRICYWTFDDGPTYLTQQFLDFAAEQDIHVTFFTSREANASAMNDDPEVEKQLMRAATLGGHSIGNHTNSHQYAQYGNLYQTIDGFKEQVQMQDDWIFECTGIKPDLFRFPGGSSHAFMRLGQAPLEAALEELGYVWIDWSCDIYDNGHAEQTVHDEYVNSVYEIETLKIAMILSHDWNPNTLAAFKQAVPVLKSAGYVFLPLFSQSWTIGNTTIIFT